ncbi:MAG: hypothetical protein U5J83_00140 [Bryobacterales bacterium]|nr:hypothetical protein [Bryobacterales bacterium]
MKDLKAKLDRKENFVLVDVREIHEHQILTCPKQSWSPGQLAERLSKLDFGE